MNRILPQPTPETSHFWEGCREGVLRLQRCQQAGHVYFPPRSFCPHCGSREVEVFEASGKGILWSYVINHRPRPDISDKPYAIALVKLDEGPVMMSNIRGCPQTPAALQLDMPLEVLFEVQNEQITLPLFTPVKAPR